MQGVSELVEYGAGIIYGEQAGKGIGRHGEVAYVHDGGTLAAASVVEFICKVSHPGSLTLGGAHKAVGVEVGQMTAVGIQALPCLDRWMIYGKIVHFLELNTEEGLGHHE